MKHKCNTTVKQEKESGKHIENSGLQTINQFLQFLTIYAKNAIIKPT